MEGDGSDSLVTIKNIERELICPACKELFTHPLILPCQHSICHKCVKELLLTLDDSFNDMGSDNSNQGSPRLRLPSPSVDKIDRLNRPGRTLLSWIISRGRKLENCEEQLQEIRIFNLEKGQLQNMMAVLRKKTIIYLGIFMAKVTDQ
uniref:Tripartite motif containing 36 n=1 Tax=Rousettus aegyptiacus TaxID=9407 RepID=A0A7J8F502_ROUAE|nr:tripartite motif containing 36 [Rousettus aegyptiacus]